MIAERGILSKADEEENLSYSYLEAQIENLSIFQYEIEKYTPPHE